MAATGSVKCCVPLITPGGNPVTEVPGLKPRSPLTTVEPTLVIVELPRTAKLPAVPKFTAIAAETTPDVPNTKTTIDKVTKILLSIFICMSP